LTVLVRVIFPVVVLLEQMPDSRRVRVALFESCRD
jgi:hypothetical protein